MLSYIAHYQFINMNNKHGPNIGFSGFIRHQMDTRGDPDIGKNKRSRAPAIREFVDCIELNISRLAGCNITG